MKRIASIVLSICMFTVLALPVFAESDVSIMTNLGGEEFVSYVIPNVSETKTYSASSLGKEIDWDNEFWIDFSTSDLLVHVVPIGTTIDVSGKMGWKARALKLENGTLSYDAAATGDGKAWLKTTGEYIEVEDGEFGESKMSDGASVQFTASGFYGFSAFPHDPMDSAPLKAASVIYVSDDGSIPKGDTITTTAKPTTQDTSPISFTDGTAYTVQAGDTFGLLSLNNYGSYNYHAALYKANAEVLKKSGGKIYKGLVINIPTTIAKGVTTNTPVTAGEGEKLYTVKSGDTLGIIAQATYGNSNKYKAIFERNSDRLKNVNTIFAGQVIALPAK